MSCEATSGLMPRGAQHGRGRFIRPNRASSANMIRSLRPRRAAARRALLTARGKRFFKIILGREIASGMKWTRHQLAPAMPGQKIVDRAVAGWVSDGPLVGGLEIVDVQPAPAAWPNRASKAFSSDKVMFSRWRPPIGFGLSALIPPRSSNALQLPSRPAGMASGWRAGSGHAASRPTLYTRRAWRCLVNTGAPRPTVLDAELLPFLGWLRGERDHCKMDAIPTIEDEDAKRPNRERGPPGIARRRREPRSSTPTRPCR
jgi:hypothetical protein